MRTIGKSAHGPALRALTTTLVLTLLAVEYLLLEPIEDAMGLGFELMDWLLYRIRIGWLGRTPLDPTSPPPSLRQMARQYAACYLNRRPKIISPLSACWLRDPLVALLWAYTIFRGWTRTVPRLGR